MTATAIATARNNQRFTDATMYDVTYVGSAEMDASVSWTYLQRLAQDGTISPQIICRNRDGSDAGRWTL